MLTNLLTLAKVIAGKHAEFIRILLLFLPFRILASTLLQPGSFLVAASPDQFYYYAIGQLAAADQYPYLDYWMEFPPVFPWMIVVAYKATIALAPWNGTGLYWFNTFIRLMMVPFECGSLAVVYSITSSLYDQEIGVRTSTAFALLFAPLFVLLGWFDNVALFFLLLSLHELVRSRPLLTGLSVGIGFGIKLFPAVAIPASIQYFGRHSRLLPLFAGLMFALLLIFLPFAVASPTYTLAFFHSLLQRTSWESIWALLDGYAGYGMVAPLSIRNDPAAASWAPPGRSPSVLPWLWIDAFFAFLGAYLCTRKIDWDVPERRVAFAGLTFMLLMLYSKGYSPQWAVYIATLSLVILPGWRGLYYSVVFSILMVLEWPLAFVLMDGIPFFLSTVIVLRTAMFIVLSFHFAEIVYSGPRWVRRIAPYLAPGSLTVMIVSSLIGAPLALQALRAEQAPDNPLAGVIATWATNKDSPQQVLTAQPVIVERLASYVPSNVRIEMIPNVSGTAWIEPADWIANEIYTQDSAAVWWVQDRAQAEFALLNDEIERELTKRLCVVSDGWYATTRVTGYRPCQ